jgi:hypothetical protein
MSPRKPPDVIPSEVNPEYECIRIGSTAPDGVVATPPSEGDEAEQARLCPDGYVPRRRRRRYRLEGKRIVREGPPERNPEPPPKSG